MSISSQYLSYKTPRISIPLSKVQNKHKILQSCFLSSRIYDKDLKTDMLINQKGETMYVTFKGCSTLKDFMTSMDMRNCKIHGNDVGIHNGFCEQFKNIQQSITNEIVSRCMKGDVTDVVFNGHSRGSSISQIVSLFIGDTLKDDGIQVHCYCFGSPKTGNYLFKEALEYTLQDNLLRIETFNDLVCLLPMKPTYQHAGDALIIKNKSIFIPDEDDTFFSYYSNDYIEFVNEMTNANLLNKEQITKMIDYHSCNNYMKNLKGVVRQIKNN